MHTPLVHKIAEKFGTPLFIMQEQGILQRFRALQNAVTKHYQHATVAISYKTNLLQGLLTLLHHAGALPEVVSGIEYEIAKKIKRQDQRIIFNGPMKLTHELIQAIHDNAIINCDHLEEVERIEQVAKSLAKRAVIGLRIYFTDSEEYWNRFGFPVSQNNPHQEFFQIVERIINSPYLEMAGLHTHIGTNIRDISKFRNMSNNLCKIAIILKQHFNVELQWLDVGGGLAGISPRKDENRFMPHSLPDVEEYAEAVIQPLIPYLSSLTKPAILLFEPGRTIFEAYGSLMTRVVGKRNIEADIPEYILDAGINTLATSYVYDFPIQYFSEQKPLKLSHLFGPTCNQKDQLHSPIELPCLKTNDLLLFHGVGSYCMAFSYSFIRLRPGVVLWRGDEEVVWLREPETIAHQAILEKIPQIREVVYAAV